jgi:putative hydrolase of the HAD superfamily
MTILVLDVDGVVVLGHPQGGRWDKHLARDLGIAPEALQSRFFVPHWRSIVLGEADMMKVLEDVWHELQCDSSPRAFVDYWFANDSKLNVELLAEVDAWRARGNKAFLATVQEHTRAKYLWQTLALKEHFDGMHYSADLGAAKPDLLFYERSHIRLPATLPRDVLFLDDIMKNVEAATAFGWRARHFASADDLRAALSDEGRITLPLSR